MGYKPKRSTSKVNTKKAWVRPMANSKRPGSVNVKSVKA